MIENKFSGTDTGTLTTLTLKTLLNHLNNNKMGKQTQNAAAACTRAARWLANNPKPADTPETSDSEQRSPTKSTSFCAHSYNLKMGGMGSTGCFSGSKLTGQALGHMKLKLRSKISVPQNINYIDAFLKVLQVHLISM